MDSQTAYELASQGPFRPANSKLPVIYGIKCVYYEPPNFTLGKLVMLKYCIVIEVTYGKFQGIEYISIGVMGCVYHLARALFL